MRPVTSWRVARKADAVTSASKIVNSVAEWVSSRHVRRSNRSRFAYQSPGSGAGAGSAHHALGPGQSGAFSCTAGSLCDRTAWSREQVARFFRIPDDLRSQPPDSLPPTAIFVLGGMTRAMSIPNVIAVFTMDM